MARSLLAAALLLSVWPAAAHDMSAMGVPGGDPGNVGENKKPAASHFSYEEPQGQCGDEACYTLQQLPRLRGQMVAAHPDAKQVINDAFGRVGSDGRVAKDDVEHLDGFAAHEEAAKAKVRSLSPPLNATQVNEILDDPMSFKKYRDLLPREKRKELWQEIRGMGDDMRNTMKAHDDDPFHTGLMVTDDKWAKLANRAPPSGGPSAGGPSSGASDEQPKGMSGKEWQQGDKNNPDAYVFGAKESAQAGDLKGAVDQASQALSLDPKNVEALDVRGTANFQLNQKDAARADATKALALNPKDQTADAILKLSEGRLGAGPDLSKTSAGFDTGAQNDAGGVGAAGRGAAGAGALEANAGPSANQSSMLVRDAVASLSVGDAAAAISKLDKALALDPYSVNALNLRAMALLRQRRYGEALRDAEAALRLDPKSQVGMNSRAAALNKLKRFAEAAAQARAALEANPNDPNAYRNLAEALAGLGDRAGMLAALRKAAELDARFTPTLEHALQLPADADLNLLFADDMPGGAAVAAARGAGAPRKWNFGFIGAAAAVGGALLLVGLLPLFSRQIGDAWRKFTRHQVVRASEIQYVEALIKGQYRLGGEIASGGMGTVYEGFDIRLERPVAIKRMRDEIKSDPREKARFIQEAKLVAALHHHNIVDIYAISDDGDDVFLVFEYVKGKTLHELVSSRGRLSLAEALPILKGAVDGLEFAHGRGVIHRDLKPSNIMIDGEGAVKVMDFGIARVAKEALTKVQKTNTIVGTPPYMAPEQEKGLVRKESDVYALALCLYEMLTGRTAFSGTGAGMLMNKLDKSFAPVSTLAPELPQGIDQVFAAALDPDPAKRLASPKELLARIEAVAAGRKA